MKVYQVKFSFLPSYLRQTNPLNKAYSVPCLKIPREISTYCFRFFIFYFLNYFNSFHRISCYLKTTLKRVSQSSCSSYFALSQRVRMNIRQHSCEKRGIARGQGAKKLYQERKFYLRQSYE